MGKFLLAFVAMVVAFVLLRVQSEPLVTEHTPMGILELEFCSSKSELERLLISWQVPVVEWAIIFDFVFILTFAMVFYQGCMIVYKRSITDSWSRFAAKMVMVALVPPALDILENVLMLFTLNNQLTELTLAITPVVATVKFILAAVVVLYLLVSLPLSYVIPKKAVISE